MARRTSLLVLLVSLAATAATGAEPNFPMNPITEAPKNLMCGTESDGYRGLACDVMSRYGELKSPIGDLGKTALALRLVYLPSLTVRSVVRVEVSWNNGAPAGRMTVRTEIDNPSNRRVAQRFVRTVQLPYDETSLILRELHFADFFAVPNRSPRVNECLDAQEQVVEIAIGDRYHFAEMLCENPDYPNNGGLGELPVILPIIVRAHMGKELPEFPGH